MGGDQGLDWRPSIVAFSVVNAPPLEHDAEGSPTLQDFITAALAANRAHHDLLFSTAAMFVEATDCSPLTAMSLAYTLHCQANELPI